MLETMRQNANKWFIKLLLILVMASFVLWGVLDMIMRPQGNQTVAQVGSHKISFENLTHSVERIMHMFQQRNIRNIDPSVIVDRALNDLINAQLINQELQQLDLIVSDAWLRDVVHNMPPFQSNGRFDPELFRTLLKQNHMSDVRFLAELREQIKTQQYTSTIISGTTLPKNYIKHVIQAIHTPYVFTTVSVTASQMPEPKAAKAEELQLFYTNNATHYTQPEKRTIHVLHVNTSKLVENMHVDEADVKALFAKRTGAETTAEKRDVQSLTFPTRAAAEKAIAKIKDRKTLKDVSKQLPQAQYQEASFEQAQAPQAIANILFTLKENGHTGIVETTNGYSIFQVTHIHASNAPKLNAATYKEIEQEIRSSRGGDTIKEWLDQLNDALASGQTIQDIAKKFNLNVSTVDILESGKTENGKGLTKLKPDVCEKIAKEAFSLSESQTSPLIETNDGLAFVVGLEKITASRTLEFQEVEAHVKNHWIQNEKEKMMDEKCRTLAKSINLSDFTKAATSMGFKVETHKPVSYAQLQTALTSDKKEKSTDVPAILLEMDNHAIANLFSMQKHECMIGQSSNGGLIVTILNKCLKPSTTTDQKLEAGMNAAFERDVSSLLVSALRKKNPVHIEHAAVKQLTERLQQNGQ